MSPWFLGPKAENLDLLRELVLEAPDSHVAFRRGFHPEDPSHVIEAVRASPAFQDGVAELRRQVGAAVREAVPVRPLCQHALPGSHALGPGAAGDGRADRGAALQSEQRGRTTWPPRRRR